jgi:Protein of unknown function, DUF547
MFIPCYNKASFSLLSFVFLSYLRMGPYAGTIMMRIFVVICAIVCVCYCNGEWLGRDTVTPSSSTLPLTLTESHRESRESLTKNSLSDSVCESALAEWSAIVSDPSIVGNGTMQGIHVHTVSYEKLRSDPSKLTSVVSNLAKCLPLKTKEWYLALYINAYNALAMHMVTHHPCNRDMLPPTPIESIKDIGNSTHPVWKKPAGVLAGNNVTLDDVEAWLRDPTPWMEDPRIHSAIVCASISCPDVRQEVYMPHTLDAQLSDQMRRFLNNTGKGLSLDRDTATLTLSEIFKWYKADFSKNGSSVLEFLHEYMPTDVQEYLQQRGNNVTLDYFQYNWDLNGPLGTVIC